MQYTGTQKQEIGMGALCKFFSELEINSVRNSANKYFCDVGAIGLLNKDKKTNKYRLKCTGGRLDKKNRIVRLGKDSSGKYTGSKVSQKDEVFISFINLSAQSNARSIAGEAVCQEINFQQISSVSPFFLMRVKCLERKLCMTRKGFKDIKKSVVRDVCRANLQVELINNE